MDRCIKCGWFLMTAYAGDMRTEECPECGKKRPVIQKHSNDNKSTFVAQHLFSSRVIVDELENVTVDKTCGFCGVVSLDNGVCSSCGKMSPPFTLNNIEVIPADTISAEPLGEKRFLTQEQVTFKADVIFTDEGRKIIDNMIDEYENVVGAVHDLMSTKIVTMSNWLDMAKPESMSHAGHTWSRVAKPAEEAGEVIDAYSIFTGSNHRKGKIKTKDDVLYELLDTAVAALGVYEHLTGNTGTSVKAMNEHLDIILKRAGIG